MTKKTILCLLFVLTLILPACSGGDEESQTAEQSASDGAQTTQNREVAEPELEAELTASKESLDLSNTRTLDQIDQINSFRLRITLQLEGEAFEGQEDFEALDSGVNIEGAFVKEPTAQHIVMSLGGNNNQEVSNIEFIQVGDKGYTNFAGQWIEAPIDDAPSIEDLAFITPKDLADKLEQLERIGDTEQINGRETIHLRADKDTLAKLNSGDQDLGIPNEAEVAEMDLWLDQSESFIVKMQILAEGKGLNEENPQATGRVEMTLEYYDFNEEIVIQAPETSG